MEIQQPWQQLPLGSQQLGGLRLTVHRGIAEYSEQLENGARLTVQFGRGPVPPHHARMMREEEEPEDKFRFTLWK
ncbi:hypothetical protein AAVH_33898 [Aphelenchoides avenae]|nr:hypothetical protein AAVH_33898 [Aphelenchus avenae]